MVKVFIAVMDYSTGCIWLTQNEFSKDYTSDDIENWLVDEHGYRDSTSYYMYSEEPITIEQRP